MLRDVVMWLFNRIGVLETEARHSCMELVFKFIPSLPVELNSRHKFINHIINKHSVAYIRDR